MGSLLFILIVAVCLTALMIHKAPELDNLPDN